MTNTHVRVNVAVIFAAVTALAGLIVYLVTSFTGYLAGSEVGMLPVVFTVVALVLQLALGLGGAKLHPAMADLMILVSAALVIASFATFAMARISLVADVYFIPVNYPASEELALRISVVGLVLYVVSIITMIVTAFAHKDAV